MAAESQGSERMVYLCRGSEIIPKGQNCKLRSCQRPNPQALLPGKGLWKPAGRLTPWRASPGTVCRSLGRTKAGPGKGLPLRDVRRLHPPLRWPALPSAHFRSQGNSPRYFDFVTHTVFRLPKGLATFTYGKRSSIWKLSHAFLLSQEFHFSLTAKGHGAPRGTPRRLRVRWSAPVIGWVKAPRPSRQPPRCQHPTWGA